MFRFNRNNTIVSLVCFCCCFCCCHRPLFLLYLVLGVILLLLLLFIEILSSSIFIIYTSWSTLNGYILCVRRRFCSHSLFIYSLNILCVSKCVCVCVLCMCMFAPVCMYAIQKHFTFVQDPKQQNCYVHWWNLCALHDSESPFGIYILRWRMLNIGLMLSFWCDIRCICVKMKKKQLKKERNEMPRLA